MSDPFTTADWERLLGSVAQVRERMESGDLYERVPERERQFAIACIERIERWFQDGDTGRALLDAKWLSIALSPYVTIGPP